VFVNIDLAIITTVIEIRLRRFEVILDLNS